MEMLGHQNITYSDVAGKGAKQIGFDEVAIDVAAEYAAEDSDITLRLTHALQARLKDETLKLYEELELPLIDVLADMEMTGVKVDREHLKKMSSKLSKALKKHEDEIYAMAGEPFNINSPKQLAVILFEKLGCPPRRKPRPATRPT